MTNKCSNCKLEKSENDFLKNNKNQYLMRFVNIKN